MSVIRQRGFALILVLALLAMLVLALYGLSALVKISGRIAMVSAYQVQAKQNALLGLDVALGELKRHTRDTTRLTGMAGITGIAANASHRTRHWGGVWTSDGSWVEWLASGATASAGIVGEEIELVGRGSVGAPTANSEPVAAGKVTIRVADLPGQGSGLVRQGAYAYAVLDEGTKIAAYAPGASSSLMVFANSATSAAGRLRDALTAYAGKLPLVLSYEQLALLPTPGAALTPSVLQDNFHQVTLRSRFFTASGEHAGLVNVNTNSAQVWRSLLQSYNGASGVTATIPSATINTRGSALANAVAAYSGVGKSQGGPFRSVESVADFLASVFPATGSPTAVQLMAVLTPALAVRSDTFRIRAYGEAVNPLEPTKTEASTYAEAIVQRQSDGSFTTIYFRWLGPEDV